MIETPKNQPIKEEKKSLSFKQFMIATAAIIGTASPFMNIDSASAQGYPDYSKATQELSGTKNQPSSSDKIYNKVFGADGAIGRLYNNQMSQNEYSNATCVNIHAGTSVSEYKSIIQEAISSKKTELNDEHPIGLIFIVIEGKNNGIALEITRFDNNNFEIKQIK